MKVKLRRGYTIIFPNKRVKFDEKGENIHDIPDKIYEEQSWKFELISPVPAKEKPAIAGRNKL